MAVAYKIEMDPKLSRVFDEIEPGAEVVFTHRGQTVGRVVKPVDASLEDGLDALEAELCAIAARAKLGPIDLAEIISWRNEGRR